jgi:hypothetical protein
MAAVYFTHIFCFFFSDARGIASQSVRHMSAAELRARISAHDNNVSCCVFWGGALAPGSPATAWSPCTRAPRRVAACTACQRCSRRTRGWRVPHGAATRGPAALLRLWWPCRLVKRSSRLALLRYYAARFWGKRSRLCARSGFRHAACG